MNNIDALVSDLQRRISEDPFDVDAVSRLYILNLRLKQPDIDSYFDVSNKPDHSKFYLITELFTDYLKTFAPVEVKPLNGNYLTTYQFLLLPGSNFSYGVPLLNGLLYINKDKTVIRMVISTIDDHYYHFTRNTNKKEADVLFNDILSYINDLYDKEKTYRACTMPDWSVMMDDLRNKFNVFEFGND